MFGTALILVFTLVCIAIEVLIGRKRGIIMNGIRLGFTVIGAVIAGVLTNSITEAILKAVVGERNGVIDVVGLIKPSETLSPMVEPVEGLIVGLGLSILAPFIFGVLFILMKLVTLGLYLIFKAVIKKTPIGATLTNTEHRLSRVAGAVLGGLVAVYSIALFALPVSGLVSTVGEWADSVEDTVQELSPAILSASDKLTITESTGMVSDALGVASTIPYTVTGANGLAGAIYRSVSEVEISKLGYSELETETVSFPVFFEGLLSDTVKVVPEINTIVQQVNGKENITLTDLDLPKLTDSVGKLVNVYVVDSTVIADADKLLVINSIVPEIKSYLKEAVTVADLSGLVHTYSSMSDFKKGFDNLMDAASKLSKVTLKTDDSGQVKWDETIRDKENLSAVVDTLAVMSTEDSESVKQIINETAASLIIEAGGSQEDSQTDMTQYIQDGVLDNIDENKEDIVSAISIATEIADYYDESKASELTEDEVEQKINEIEKLGVVTPEAIEELRKQIGK